MKGETAYYSRSQGLDWQSVAERVYGDKEWKSVQKSKVAAHQYAKWHDLKWPPDSHREESPERLEGRKRPTPREGGVANQVSKKHRLIGSGKSARCSCGKSAFQDGKKHLCPEGGEIK